MNFIIKSYTFLSNKRNNILELFYRFILNPLLRIHYRLYGVILGKKCKFWGTPKIVRKLKSIVEIGDNCRFRSKSTSNLIGINHKCIISTMKEGAVIQIGSKCGLSGTVISAEKKVVLGNNVLCGANTTIIDTNFHPNDPRSGKAKDVYIKDNVWLGVNSIVLKGVTIGENTIIGANSVVTGDIPANVVAAGNPCKVIRELH